MHIFTIFPLLMWFPFVRESLLLTELLFADVVLRAALPAPDHRVQPELLHDARPLLRLLRPGRVQGEREGRAARGRGLLSLLSNFALFTFRTGQRC